MLKLNQQTLKTLVSVHGWSGISLGLLLYAVIVTGTVAVFSEEIAHWSVGLVRQENPLRVSPDANAEHQRSLQGLVDALAPQVKQEYLQEVALNGNTIGNLIVFFHKHQTNEDGVVEEVGTQFEVDPNSGAVISSRDGTGIALFETDDHRALSRFLVSVHTELHIPSPWGLLLTGILGLSMMVAAISGLFIHRHLLKDLFVLRSGSGNTPLRIKDAHTVAASWGLPFAVVLAFTGSFFSFAGSFGLPLMAIVGFGGDQAAMFDVMLGSPVPEDKRSEAGPGIDSIIRDAQARTGDSPEFLVVEHFGRADAMATLFMPVPDESLVSNPLVYAASTGEFQRAKPQVGQTESAGAMLFAMMSPLHFGHFLGVVSKSVWTALGFAMCFVTVTGMRLWLVRREEAMYTKPLQRALELVVFGLPLAMAGAGYGFLLSYGSGNASSVTPWAFLSCAGAAIVIGFLIRDARRLAGILASAVGVACLLLVPLRLVMGGPGWIESVLQQQTMIVSIDLLLLLCGVALIARVVRQDIRVKEVSSRIEVRKGQRGIA